MPNNNLVQYKANYMTDAGDKIELNNEIVRKVLAVGNDISEVELFSFIKLCEYQKLNPFIKEAYLIKWGKQVQMVVGIDVFTNRLNEHPLCEGWKAGLKVESNGEIINRDGTFYLKGKEKIVGAWFEVNRKGWKDTFPWTVTFDEYYRETMDKETKKYKGMGQWATMPAVMIVKCVIAAGCRKAFPKSFNGMYSPEEVGVNISDDENIIPLTDDNVKNSTKPQPQIISETEVQNIKNAAKSPLVEIESEKLIEFVLNEFVKLKKINKDTTIENLHPGVYDLFLGRIKKLVLTKEKQAAKDPLPDIKQENKVENKPAETKIEKDINIDTDLPVKEMEYAKPANTSNLENVKNETKK